jgi:hypothetical protein
MILWVGLVLLGLGAITYVVLRLATIVTAAFTGVTWGCMRDMGTPGSPPTRITAIPDKWFRPTKRPVDLSVGPIDLVGGPHNILKTFPKLPQTT